MTTCKIPFGGVREKGEPLIPQKRVKNRGSKKDTGRGVGPTTGKRDDRPMTKSQAGKKYLWKKNAYQKNQKYLRRGEKKG